MYELCYYQKVTFKKPEKKNLLIVTAKTMRKQTLLLIVSIFAFLCMYSQERKIEVTDPAPVQQYEYKSVTGISDFTVTDSEGVTWNLYEILESGKTVFVDLFFTT